jgi:hypothetical protein
LAPPAHTPGQSEFSVQALPLLLPPTQAFMQSLEVAHDAFAVTVCPWQLPAQVVLPFVVKLHPVRAHSLPLQVVGTHTFCEELLLSSKPLPFCGIDPHWLVPV